MDCRYKKECEEKGMFGVNCSDNCECGLMSVLDKQVGKKNYLVIGSNNIFGRAVIKSLRRFGHKVNEYSDNSNLPTVKVSAIVVCDFDCDVEVLEYAKNFNIDKIVYVPFPKMVDDLIKQVI